jgi:DNA end-binding protein Ku
VTPDDPVGEEAYCVIRDAMRSTAMVGVSRLVLNRRERAVILKPRDQGIVLWTLRFGDEVREAREYFASIRDQKPDPELMRLIGDLITLRKKAWSPDMAADPVQAKLLDIIEAKKKA